MFAVNPDGIDLYLLTNIYCVEVDIKISNVTKTKMFRDVGVEYLFTLAYV